MPPLLVPVLPVPNLTNYIPSKTKIRQPASLKSLSAETLTGTFLLSVLSVSQDSSPMLIELNVSSTLITVIMKLFHPIPGNQIKIKPLFPIKLNGLI